MPKGAYLIPYAVWVAITFAVVRLEWIDDPVGMWMYGIYSLVIATILEVVRNRRSERLNEPGPSRIFLYVGFNAVWGLPYAWIHLYAHLPLKIPAGLFEETLEGTLMAWQQFLFLGYWMLWFAGSALIVRPSGVKSALLLGAGLLLTAFFALGGWVLSAGVLSALQG